MDFTNDNTGTPALLKESGNYGLVLTDKGGATNGGSVDTMFRIKTRDGEWEIAA